MRYADDVRRAASRSVKPRTSQRGRYLWEPDEHYAPVHIFIYIHREVSKQVRGETLVLSRQGRRGRSIEVHPKGLAREVLATILMLDSLSSEGS